MSTRSAAFATTHGVINRVHGHHEHADDDPPNGLRAGFAIQFSLLWSGFDTVPIVARQEASTLRVSPEGILMMA